MELALDFFAFPALTGSIERFPQAAWVGKESMNARSVDCWESTHKTELQLLYKKCVARGDWTMPIKRLRRR